MFTGLTVATITGVPIGTFIGQQFGWRASFMAIVVIGIIAFIANSILVPSNLKNGVPVSFRDQFKLIKKWKTITCFHYYCTWIRRYICNIYVFITPITRSNRV